MNSEVTILIVEDDMSISSVLSNLLQANGYNTCCAYSGTEALMRIKDNAYHLILLDLMLPGINGEQVLEYIRKESNIPIIVTSAKDDKLTKISILQMGADDYMTKPFDIDELLARIQVQLRRTLMFGNNTNKEQKFNYKDLVLNLDTHEVTVKGVPVLLTKIEFLILKLFMTYPRKVFSKSNIYTHVWDDNFLGDERTINVHISNLRTKLAVENSEEEYIQTIWGVGYKMKDYIER